MNRIGFRSAARVGLALLVGIGARRAAAADAMTLDAVLDEFGSMALATDGIPVKDRKISFGHMEISFAEGTLVPVLGKTGSVIGLYFEGRGGYLYSTESFADREAMRINAAAVANALRPAQGRIADDFKSGLILFTEPQARDLYTGETAPKVVSATLADGFKTTLAGAMSTYGEFDFRAAIARLNGRGLFAYAELAGGLERVGYAYDDLIHGRERFFAFRMLADYNARFSETLSDQPIPGWDIKRRTAVKLTHAQFAISTEDNKSGTIDSDMTFRVGPAGTRVLALTLINNRDPDSADWNSPRQKLTLKRVLDADGKELPFSHKYGEVVVEIPATPAADHDVKVRFETAGEVFLDMNGRHTDNYFTLGLGDWYPSPHTWAGQHFTFKLQVRCRKPWYPVASGKLLTQRDEGGFVVQESGSDRPAALVTVFAGKYTSRAESTDGVTVRIHAYAMARKNVLDNMPKLAGAMVKFYTSMLGPMPAEELDIVEVPEYGFGISPSGVILLTTEAYKPHQDEIANYFARGINARLAHEIAHQWFGHKVVPADPTDNWLSESFAEYYSGLAIGALAGDDKTIYGFNRMIAEWKAEDRYCDDGAPIAVASYLGGENGWKDRRCLLYDRGPLVLHMLRTSIGNERFAAASRAFLERANAGAGSTDDYAKAISDAVQMDMRWYFDQWVRRSGNAQVAVEHHVDPAGGGQFKLWGTIRQSPGDGFKKLLVPLVWESGGKTEARVVFVDQPEKKFEFVLPSKPGTVKPDPFGNNLAVYK